VEALGGGRVYRPPGDRKTVTVRIDVVVPTKNRSYRLWRILSPLAEDPAVDRLILVDDRKGGTEESLRRLSPKLSDSVEVVSAGGVGPAKARQAGAEMASAEVLLFIDDDVVAEPGLASRHAAYHERRSKLLVCGYTPVVPVEGRRPSPEASVYEISYERRCRQYDLDNRDVLTHLWGGNFSLRREDALAVGLSSPDFHEAWHEDRDFGLRCRQAGLDAVFDRDLRAGHEYERAWQDVEKESYYRGYSLAVLHEIHSEVIGPFDERYFERHRALPLRFVVRTFSQKRRNQPAARALLLIRRLAARLHLRTPQLLSVRMLRLLQNASGASDALKAQRLPTQPSE
jgi:GT2 family glycosyltransferase